MGQLLKKFREAQITSSSRGTKPSSAWTTERMEVGERDSVLLKPHSTVYIKLSMLRMDEIVGQTPLKDLDQIQLVLTRMPAKALYQLQVSVDHEIQSRAHKNMVELQQATKKQETLETVCAQAKSETQEEKECRNELERRVEDIFGKLPTTAQGSELPAAEKIDQIAQAIDQYQKEIETLRGQIRPTTPPTVKVQRKQEATVQLQELEK
jgi:DNA anti-recombination protein RmuC